MNFGIDLGFSSEVTEKEKQWIIDQGTLVYVADRNSPSLRFQDEADDQYKGLLINYINSISLEIGTKIELRPMLWETVLESLSTGETDISDMFASKYRGKNYVADLSEALLLVAEGVADATLGNFCV